LTYKSIDIILSEHLAATPPRLVRLPLVYDPDESEKRELFMPTALAQTLQQNDPKKAREYTANIRAFIGRFVKGGLIDNQDYMKCWKADVFELRVQNQRPGQRLRIFGAFARKDTFVCFFRRPRDYFGPGADPKWDEEIVRAVAAWEQMFPHCRRVRARPFSNCLSNNFADVYA
jgi:hypothetical protein